MKQRLPLFAVFIVAEAMSGCGGTSANQSPQKNGTAVDNEEGKRVDGPAAA